MTTFYQSHLVDALRSAIAADDTELSADLAKLIVSHGIETDFEIRDDGPYCLWWENMKREEGAMTETRYVYLSDARAACEIANQIRIGSCDGVLIRYGVAKLNDETGEWEEVFKDE